MAPNLVDLQSSLPRSISLLRYAPHRPSFDWQNFDPSKVTSADDLPPYLIMGELDQSSFQKSPKGWEAIWRGYEQETDFTVCYAKDSSQWQISQRWKGNDGGAAYYSTRTPLSKVIGQALYLTFPKNWDAEAKQGFESDYQMTWVEQPEGSYSFCGIPDGSLRTIMFPVSVSDLESFQNWVQKSVKNNPPNYPVLVSAKLIFQAVNYHEGHAPDWTRDEGFVFHQSLSETGLMPMGFPVRETSKDGSAAWTLRRESYFILIGVPFVAVDDFLKRLVGENSPVRNSSHPHLRFERQPLIIPAGFEYQTQSASFWDRDRTTRIFLQFSKPDEEVDIPDEINLIANEHRTLEYLRQAQSISQTVIETIDGLIKAASKEK